jgi:hypothetical protein
MIQRDVPARRKPLHVGDLQPLLPLAVTHEDINSKLAAE